MTCCPNCGYRHGEYGAELAQLHLPKLKRRILTRLIRAQGGIVPTEAVIDAMYGDFEDGGPESARTCLENHVSRLRGKLAPWGWTIKCDRFLGYRLVERAAL